MPPLAQRIDDLPSRLDKYKDLLHTVVEQHRCSTKTHVRKACQDYITDCDRRLKDTPKTYTRLRDQLTLCKRHMRDCLQKAVRHL